MRLLKGTRAPHFEGLAVSGRVIRLEAMSHPIRHLQFHRFAGCPVCNLAVQAYLRSQADLQAVGVETILFFHSPVEELRRHLAGTKLPFEVVGDPKRIVYQRYGVERRRRGILSGAFMAQALRGMAAGFISKPWGQVGGITGLPADFLIDADGVIRLARYGRHAADGLSVDALLETVGRLDGHPMATLRSPENWAEKEQP